MLDSAPYDDELSLQGAEAVFPPKCGAVPTGEARVGGGRERGKGAGLSDATFPTVGREMQESERP